MSRPQLNNTRVFSVGLGARRQELRRDDKIFHNEVRALRSHEDYTIGRDTSISFFVAGKKTTEANGATRFIPRSHLWAKTTPPNEDLERCVLMSAFVLAEVYAGPKNGALHFKLLSFSLLRMSNMSNKSAGFTCDVCQRTFKRKDHLSRHRVQRMW